jgi:hypothetical protein
MRSFPRYDLLSRGQCRAKHESRQIQNALFCSREARAVKRALKITLALGDGCAGDILWRARGSFGGLQNAAQLLQGFAALSPIAHSFAAACGGQHRRAAMDVA